GGATGTSPRDGTPGNPPSTATQRAIDGVTGNRTPADGTPGNPPGTAAGRAMDRTLGTNTTGANPGANPGATGTSTTAAGAGAGATAVDSAALRDGRRASRIIGANIYNENNESIGEVEDILIPPMTAATGGAPGMGGMSRAPVAVISVGGFLGIGAKLVAVPYERLQWNAERNRWTVTGATKESLNALPTFSYDSLTGDRRG
ncbi:MAG: PRC-barrel domain-containing protein, partial [Acetobacteraceae bacterium]|nr:PRC-barrel domain-containing protein [Acetobacteraceae bacterium]